MTDKLNQGPRFAGTGTAIKCVRWSGLALLLFMGVAGTTTLIDFSRAAAVKETYGFSAAYTAARLTLLGETSGSLQNWDWFRAQTRRYGFKATDIFAGNPPSAALVMVPIAALPYRQGELSFFWGPRWRLSAPVDALSNLLLLPTYGRVLIWHVFSASH